MGFPSCFLIVREERFRKNCWSVPNVKKKEKKKTKKNNNNKNNQGALAGEMEKEWKRASGFKMVPQRC